jgi:hypothetical protein
MTVLTWVVTTVLKWLSAGALDKVLGGLQTWVNNETERQRIKAIRDQHMATVQGTVLVAAMEHKWFWIPWLMATVPMAGWFGLGMLNTAFPGWFPIVATIPLGLEPWARAAWDGLFFSGAGVASATSIAKAIRR